MVCNFWEIYKEPSVDGWQMIFDYLNLWLINFYTFLWNLMTQRYTFNDNEITLFAIKQQIALFILFLYLNQINAQIIE